MVGANAILVDYDELDPRIGRFVDQMEQMVKSGASFKADIKVNANNTIEGMKLERTLEKLKMKLDINEVVKGLSTFHYDMDTKLCEIENICLGDMDER